jgi:predicted metal-dependent HD superfamily phosphohydrolase
MEISSKLKLPRRVNLSPWARQVMATPNVSAENTGIIIADFESAYNAEDRYHHNIGHLNFMLKLIEKWSERFDDPGVALWATIGHDCFMDFTNTVPGKNEQISSQHTEARLEGIFETDRLNAVKAYIGATATHKLPVSELPAGSVNDLKMFLDADNGCIGADPRIYKAYKRGVRQEYIQAGVNIEKYNLMRLAFLENYSSAEPCFISGPGFSRFEEQAKINMSTEMAELRKTIHQ